MQKTTIFKQLVLNVIIPVIIALLGLGVLNYQNTKGILEESNEKKNQIISDEIKSIMTFQDVSINIIEKNLNKRVEEISNKLYLMLKDIKSLSQTELRQIQLTVGLDPKMEDIYLIDVATGVVVNTTYDKDMNLNVFNFGESYKNYLLEIVKNKKYVGESFTPETSTNKLKKYTYRPSLDGKYIIETGHYSKDVDDIKELVKQRFEKIMKKGSSLAFVGLYIGADDPIELNSGAVIKSNDSRKALLKKAFVEKGRKILDTIEHGKHLHYEFVHMERKKASLYKSSVIVIVSDRTAEIKLLRFEFLKSLIIFGLTLFVVILLIYLKTKSITMPIKKLLNNVLRITAGNFEERAEVEGNNEITTLSEKFNEMLGTIEGYYNVLEEKVRERTAEIAKQKDHIEEQKKRITDSIHYAKRIQDAILPPENIFNSLLKDAFVLYKPREIVSGDFYWVTKHNEKIIVAAVDCTGHGVPGAFMSMLGYAFLNEIVSKAKDVEAAEILYKLRDNVVTSLRQTDEIGGSKDGMDISLCVIDQQNLTLQFAGANNPLYLITKHHSEQEVQSDVVNETQESKLVEIKANKFPIGINRKGMVPFTNHEIKFHQGDVIYVFSDGYADQFGGPEGWKFMTVNFKKLLTENSHLPMEEQKRILDENLEAWKHNTDQTDDILVIGIRF